MEPFILMIFGFVTATTSVVIHELWTDYFGYTMCKMALECCEEECMGDSYIVVTRH